MLDIDFLIYVITLLYYMKQRLIYHAKLTYTWHKLSTRCVVPEVILTFKCRTHAVHFLNIERYDGPIA